MKQKNPARTVDTLPRTTRARAVTASVRRTQAHRRAATREKVIEATKGLLYSQGYTGTTTLAIRDAAGISSGAIQGQFPTKAGIMAAIVTEITEERKRRYGEAMHCATAHACVERFLDVSVEISLGKDPIILTEILLAKRNDLELSALVDPIAREFSAWFTGMSNDLFQELGVSKEAFEILKFMNNSFLRGIGLELLVSYDKPEVLRAVAVWKQAVMSIALEAVSL